MLKMTGPPQDARPEAGGTKNDIRTSLCDTSTFVAGSARTMRPRSCQVQRSARILRFSKRPLISCLATFALINSFMIVLLVLY